METHSRRYIFIAFEDLKRVKLKKLEKVCDKVFILIDSEEDSIPFTLVQQMQRFGKSARWIQIPRQEFLNTSYHLSFIMGKLHQKVSPDIEFAILSNDHAFDPLVKFINNENRSCLRVKRKRTNQEKMTELQQFSNGPVYVIDQPSPAGSGSSDFSNLLKKSNGLDPIDDTARDTKERLIRSGTRPAGLDHLRSYIRLHNQELIEHSNVDQVIQRLKESDEIKIDKGEVIYNF